jgi:hypothetical protein
MEPVINIKIQLFLNYFSNKIFKSFDGVLVSFVLFNNLILKICQNVLSVSQHQMKRLGGANSSYFDDNFYFWKEYFWLFQTSLCTFYFYITCKLVLIFIKIAERV